MTGFPLAADWRMERKDSFLKAADWRMERNDSFLKAADWRKQGKGRFCKDETMKQLKEDDITYIYIRPACAPQGF